MAAVLILLALLSVAQGESYFPPYLEGTPTSAIVDSIAPTHDYRGLTVFRINFTILTSEGKEVSSFVHRSYGEFAELNSQLKWLVWWNRGWELPPAERSTVGSLSKMIAAVIKDSRLVDKTVVHDFLGINWRAQGVRWFEDLKTFLHMVTLARVPKFPPEPVKIDSEEDAMRPETPFELYVYIKAFRALKDGVAGYLDFFRNYTNLTPGFSGPSNDEDVWPPGAVSPIALPYHYTRTFVHFLPGGYTNGHNVRISYCGYSKFNFLKEDVLRTWIKKVHKGRQPRRILDLGTGGCFSAMVYAEMFPEAEVIGIDLAAPFIRFCRMWAQSRKLTNVKFYQDNGESTHFNASSFDIVHFAYVIHEMPESNARLVLNEIKRILTPGGVLSGFEVPYVDNVVLRKAMVYSQTWGYHWNSTGLHGPEPYTREYQEGTQIPKMIADVGFQNLVVYENSIFDAVYIAEK